jgi:arsenate reductase
LFGQFHQIHFCRKYSSQGRRGSISRFSAGSTPARIVHPFAIRILESVGYPTDGLYPKNWFQFAEADVPEMDFVLTVCDMSAPEHCPTWPGQPHSARWSTADPALFNGPEEEQVAIFVRTFYEIRGRIAMFMALSFDRLDRMALQDQLVSIGDSDGGYPIKS